MLSASGPPGNGMGAGRPQRPHRRDPFPREVAAAHTRSTPMFYTEYNSGIATYSWRETKQTSSQTGFD